MQIKLMDYFSKGPVKNTNTLYQYWQNAIACRAKCRRLKKDEFLDCLAVTQVGGRGLEVKVVIDDLPRFEALESEIKTLGKRAEDIDKMLLALQDIISKSGDIEIQSPTPDGLRSGVGQRRKRIEEIRLWLAREADKKMGIDTFETPLAGPGNIAEVRKKDLDETNAKISQMKKEIETLESLFKECTKIMVENRHLLAPAEEPVIEPEPRIGYWEKNASQVFVRGDEPWLKAQSQVKERLTE